MELNSKLHVGNLAAHNFFFVFVVFLRIYLNILKTMHLGKLLCHCAAIIGTLFGVFLVFHKPPTQERHSSSLVLSEEEQK